MNSPFNQPVSPIAKNFVSPFPTSPHLMPARVNTEAMGLGVPMGTGKWKFAASQLQADLNELKKRQDGQEN
jgi:hypothetical protein